MPEPLRLEGKQIGGAARYLGKEGWAEEQPFAKATSCHLRNVAKLRFLLGITVRGIFPKQSKQCCRQNTVRV